MVPARLSNTRSSFWGRNGIDEGELDVCWRAEDSQDLVNPLGKARNANDTAFLAAA